MAENMSTIEEKVEEAWFDYEYQAHGNLYSTCFKDGYMQGAAEALRSQWVSVEEEKPQFDGKILLCRDSYWVALCTWDNDLFIDASNGEVFMATHWMPIPPLPEARKEGEV